MIIVILASILVDSNAQSHSRNQDEVVLFQVKKADVQRVTTDDPPSDSDFEKSYLQYLSNPSRKVQCGSDPLTDGCTSSFDSLKVKGKSYPIKIFTQTDNPHQDHVHNHQKKLCQQEKNILQNLPTEAAIIQLKQSLCKKPPSADQTFQPAYIMEHVTSRDLSKLIDMEDNKELIKSHIDKIVDNLVKAVAIMRQHKIIHGNINLENMALIKNGKNAQVKLLDFHLAQNFSRAIPVLRRTQQLHSIIQGQSKHHKIFAPVGNAAGMPLDQYSKKNYTFTAITPAFDMYSLGAAFYELCFILYTPNKEEFQKRYHWYHLASRGSSGEGDQCGQEWLAEYVTKPKAKPGEDDIGLRAKFARDWMAKRLKELEQLPIDEKNKDKQSHIFDITKKLLEIDVKTRAEHFDEIIKKLDEHIALPGPLDRTAEDEARAKAKDFNHEMHVEEKRDPHRYKDKDKSGSYHESSSSSDHTHHHGVAPKDGLTNPFEAPPDGKGTDPKAPAGAPPKDASNAPVAADAQKSPGGQNNDGNSTSPRISSDNGDSATSSSSSDHRSDHLSPKPDAASNKDGGESATSSSSSNDHKGDQNKEDSATSESTSKSGDQKKDAAPSSTSESDSKPP